jgi:hypothetical protein
MKKLILALFLPFLVSAQIAPEFVHLKPMFTKTEQFSYTGAVQQWVVPVGVTQVFIDVFGAQGGNSMTSTGRGGLGGKVRAILPVTPGETLLLMVGGQPTSRTAVYGNGGNAGTNTSNVNNENMAGGGMSAVFRTSFDMTNALLVAGAGGGAALLKNGGIGGGATGGNHDLRSGYGGTQTAGGASGEVLDLQSVSPTSGQSGQGGNGGSTTVSTHSTGGGGGAGYFGGGGGVAGGAGYGSGGGGSSWALPSLTKIATMSNFNSGHGKIIIYYND